MIGAEFTYRDRITGEWRVGYYHRESARFTAVDIDGLILSHFRSGEDYVADLDYSTYEDLSEVTTMETTRTRKRKARQEGPLGEVHRRLVGIHAALAERTNSDPEVRPWTVHQLMDILRYIESVEDQSPSS